MSADTKGDAWEGEPPEPSVSRSLKLYDRQTAPTLLDRTRDQTFRAEARLDEDFTKCPQTPWDSVNRVIGHGLLPDQFWVLAASSGHGKSTALMNLLAAWVEEGRRVYMLPLEQPTDVMRIYWAALAFNYPTKYVLRNAWHLLPPTAKEYVAEHIRWQRGEGASLVHFSDERFVDEGKLVRAMEEAAEFGAEVVVVDHLHRLGLTGHDRYAAWESMCNRVKELANSFRIPVIGAAQINERKQKGDRLRAFFPPQVDDIQNGKILEQVSDVVMAAYRPLRADITAAEIKEVRMGSPVKPCLAQNTIGIHVLKSRIEGEIGDVLQLGYKGGKITCPETEERMFRIERQTEVTHGET